MKVLGIDPGYGRCGWACLEKESNNSNNVSLVELGTINTSKDAAPIDRLWEIYKSTLKLIEKFKPDAIAIEELHEPHGVRRISTLLKNAEVRGALFIAARETNVDVDTVHPLTAKSMIALNGRASKQEVQKFLMRILKTDLKTRYDDAWDAAAIAFVYLSCSGLKKAIKI
ncbi:crossover junction endodeoxyribonuclease RuvC [Elusimicrobiota bacterium]